MVSVTAILLAAICGGFATTYLYDSRATLLTRWAAGPVTGLAALSLTGFLAASILGVGWPAVLVATSLTFSPAATFVVKAHREQLRADFLRRMRQYPRESAGQVRSPVPSSAPAHWPFSGRSWTAR